MVGRFRDLPLPAEDDHFLLPIFRADRGPLHLEGRYQYEDRHTGSAWLGWTLEAGKKVHLEVVPMAGAVFGRTNGVAPGLELTLSWKSVELYSENEYVFGFKLDGEAPFAIVALGVDF